MRLDLLGFVAAAAFLGVGGALAADPGAAAFRQCSGCHSIGPKATAALAGPSLAGVVGRPAAALPDFAYSDGMRVAARQHWIWSEGALDLFLTNPRAVIPRTTMQTPGITDPAERAAVISYLKGSRAR